MIEIITEQVDMPDDVSKRRYIKDCKNDKWFVFDTETNTVRYKGSFENVAIACHSLNKKYYRDIKYGSNQ